MTARPRPPAPHCYDEVETEGCVRCGILTRGRCQACGNPLCGRCTGYPHDTRPVLAPPAAAADSRLVPPAPADALAEAGLWGGDRCTCGLPVSRSEIVQALVHHDAHPGNPAILAYLNAHPHNVTTGGEPS